MCLLLVGESKGEEKEIVLGHRIGLTYQWEILTIEEDVPPQIVVGESNHDRELREAEENRLQVAVERSKTQTFKGSVERWRPLVAKYFPQSQINNVLKIMNEESGGNPIIVNNNPRTEDYSVGLMQINLYGRLKYSRPSESWLKVPENNIKYAYGMWNGAGWNPWKNSARKIGLV